MLVWFVCSFVLVSSFGVFISQVMIVVVQIVDNVYIGVCIEQMCDGVECGESILCCVIVIGVFMFIVLQMIVVGEEMGEFDMFMMEIVQMYECEIDYVIKGLLVVIEFILLVIIGVLVLVLVLGVFLLLWNLGQVVMGY